MGQQQLAHSAVAGGGGLQVWLRPEGGSPRFALVGVDQFAHAEFQHRGLGLSRMDLRRLAEQIVVEVDGDLHGDIVARKSVIAQLPMSGCPR